MKLATTERDRPLPETDTMHGQVRTRTLRPHTNQERAWTQASESQFIHAWTLDIQAGIEIK